MPVTSGHDYDKAPSIFLRKNGRMTYRQRDLLVFMINPDLSEDVKCFPRQDENRYLSIMSLSKSENFVKYFLFEYASLCLSITETISLMVDLKTALRNSMRDQSVVLFTSVSLAARLKNDRPFSWQRWRDAAWLKPEACTYMSTWKLFAFKVYR